MSRVRQLFLLAIISASANADNPVAPIDEKSLNTANVIRAAWELRRLSESLEPGIDTRCYIAKFAAFKAESLPDTADVISRYQETDADTFAIQSVEQAMQIFESNQVQKIANECKQNDS